MCLAQGPRRSDAGEARTRDPSVSSQALYHWATALPMVEPVLTGMRTVSHSQSGKYVGWLQKGEKAIFKSLIKGLK